MVVGELSDSNLKKMRPTVVSYLTEIQSKDSELFDLDIDTPDPSVFSESVGVPIMSYLKDRYKELGGYLIGNGADKGVLKEKGLYDIINNLDSAIKLKKGFMRKVSKEEEGYFRNDRLDQHMSMSKIFKDYQMRLFDIKKDEIGMPEPTKFNYESMDASDAMEQFEHRGNEYSEFVDEKPYDVKHLHYVSSELTKMLLYGSFKSGQMSGLLKVGLDDISKCGAPDDLVSAYIKNTEYFDDESSEEMITRSDTSFNKAMKLNENLRSYLERSIR